MTGVTAAASRGWSFRLAVYRPGNTNHPDLRLTPSHPQQWRVYPVTHTIASVGVRQQLVLHS